METHRPPHIYKDKTIYFISSSTLNKIRYFDTDKKKELLLDVIYRACSKFIIELSAWTILDNHYHLLTEIDRGKDIPMLINNIHTNSGRLLNKLEGSMGRKIWYQYYDRCIRSEKDYWTRFNYIHHNCIKHGYSKNMEEYKYSSYKEWVKIKGIEWMIDILNNYPVVDFSVEGEVD